MISENKTNKEKQKIPFVHVIVEKGESPQKEYYFNKTFRIGRDEHCAIQIKHGMISRDHVEVSYTKGQWWVADLFSSNGTFVDGKRIDHLILTSGLKIELGSKGPVLSLSLTNEPDRHGILQGKGSSLTGYIQRYFTDSFQNINVGQHTRMIQQAFQVVKKKQSSKYLKVVVIVALLCIVLAAYAVYQNLQANKQRALAESIFYQMKDLELSIVNLIDSLDSNKELQKQFQERRREAEKEYDKFIESLGLYKSDETERLIQKTARAFGECEINMPEEFTTEVKIYINYWRSTPRFKQAIQRAKEKNYPKYIVEQLLERDLAPQFFYLPLQESDFKEKSVGPNTYMGYAKGIWHFIVPTAEEYGLKVGPLKDTNSYDTADERFNFFKATQAATNYLKYIYNTDAQASGLLVMASYNWGERRVIRYINKLTRNPKERNFWKLLSAYGDKIPQQTYDYVFYIFSAAVIGENPRLFGFDFDNPLKETMHYVN